MRFSRRRHFCSVVKILPIYRNCPIYILPNTVTFAKKALIGIWQFVLMLSNGYTFRNKNWLLFAQAFFREIAREMEFALSPTLISPLF